MKGYTIQKWTNLLFQFLIFTFYLPFRSSFSLALLKIRQESENENSTEVSVSEQEEGGDEESPPLCESAKIDPAAYNLGLHVGALFVVLATSSFGK